MSCEQLVRKVLRSTSAMQNLLACLFFAMDGSAVDGCSLLLSMPSLKLLLDTGSDFHESVSRSAVIQSFCDVARLPCFVDSVYVKLSHHHIAMPRTCVVPKPALSPLSCKSGWGGAPAKGPRQIDLDEGP